MPQLKASFITAVKAELGKSKFTLEDFQLDFPDKSKVLARITFLYRPEYNLSLLEDLKRENVTLEQTFALTKRSQTVEETVFSVSAAPGNYKAIDSFEIGSIGDFLPQISKWCENIRTDLYALAPRTDPLEALRKQLQENLAKLVDKPDDFFNEEELLVVDERFTKLLEEISAIKEQHSITKQNLEALAKDFEEFKSSARVYPKGLWAKITGNKLVIATGSIINSPEGRTFLFKEVRRAFGLSE